MTENIGIPNVRRKTSFPAKTQPMKSHKDSIFTISLQILFFLYKDVLLSLICRNLHTTHHEYKP